MDIQVNQFDRLPDEVIRLIFSRISDFKTLVRCMMVCKAFLRQSVHVSSLSIACPGASSSYDEKMHKIYSMLKPFKNLESLVVRVGQPKEKPPSWARCMRYVEIGGFVEKFVFMAAKSGDFVELDSALLRVDGSLAVGGGRQEDKAMMWQEDKAILSHQANANKEELVHETLIGKEENDSTKSDDDSSQRLRDTSQDVFNHPYFWRELSQRRQLSDFSVRQVIAPSNNVLKRMLPVIHFAVAQGLTELRDALPAFISQFPKLTTLLLVDMVESITVYMHEHHMQDMRAIIFESNCADATLEGLVDPIGATSTSFSMDHHSCCMEDTDDEVEEGHPIRCNENVQRYAEGFSSNGMEDRCERKACRLNRDGKRGWSNRHPFKRISRNDPTKMRGCNRNSPFSCNTSGMVYDNGSCSTDGAQGKGVADRIEACGGGKSVFRCSMGHVASSQNKDEDPSLLVVEGSETMNSLEHMRFEQEPRPRVSSRDVNIEVDDKLRRERSRKFLHTQQPDMERDALAFDYSFWKVEQVGSCNYVLSDLSMCIATHAARPLRDCDKEILSYAALAGPLLVATLSQVNKQYIGHNL